VACCVVIVVPGYCVGCLGVVGGWFSLSLSCVAKGENLVRTWLDFAWFCVFVLWLTGVAKGENLVLTCLCFAWFLLFDGLALVDLGYFIAIVLVVLVWFGGVVIVVRCDCIACVYGGPLWLYCLSLLFCLSETTRRRDTETIRSQS
jgi:hypothetical protein